MRFDPCIFVPCPNYEALEVNASLLEIDLSRCEIQDTAAHFIIAAIEANRCLSVFQYERNQFSKETQDAIHYAMGRVRLPMGQILDNMEQARRVLEAESLQGSYSGGSGGGGGGGGDGGDVV